MTATSDTTVNEYLEELIDSQKLEDDSKELKELRAHRADVERLLRKHFEDCSPTIRYGGSKAKGTLILALYDLDIICYFPSDDMAAGETLEEIYNNVKTALEKEYSVIPKTSALRLKRTDQYGIVHDFHIDVVPGRYVDSDNGDCFIYQANADKKRLKTNLDVQIEHVRDSGVTDAIKLLKYWKVRKGLQVKQFVWELLIIDLLKGKSSDPLADQLVHVWTHIRDSEEAMHVEDPANPTGNDLSGVLADNWQWLKMASDSTLRAIDTQGWEAVFGETAAEKSSGRITELLQAASSAPIITKPWADGIE
jgi:hypothetical protein